MYCVLPSFLVSKVRHDEDKPLKTQVFAGTTRVVEPSVVVREAENKRDADGGKEAAGIGVISLLIGSSQSEEAFNYNFYL